MKDTGSHRFTGPGIPTPAGVAEKHPLGRIFFIAESGGGAPSALATG